MKRILSADLVQYNANNRGTRTGDCVKRSISLALGIPYAQLGKMFEENIRQNYRSSATYNQISVYRNWLLKNYGIQNEMLRPNQYNTLSELIDQRLQTGTWLVETGKKYNNINHIVCVKDGKVYDSWNSLNEVPTYIYRVPDNLTKAVSDEVSVEPYREQFIPWIEEEVQRQALKYAWGDDFELDDRVRIQTKFNFKVTMTFRLPPCEYYNKPRKYSFTFGITLSPDMDPSTIEKKLHDTLKTRAYDRCYSVNESEKKLIEADTMRRKVGKNGTDDYHERSWISPQEERFINQLPGWVRPLIDYVSIQMPGQYHDSYHLVIEPLPNSKAKGANFHRNHSDKLDFDGYTSAQVKDMLKRYKESDLIPYIDYSPEEEY